MNHPDCPGRTAVAHDAALGAWVVEDAALCRRLLAHPGLAPPPYVELYGELEGRFGLDFSNMRFAFAHIPLCLHGADHAEARKAIAALLARRRPAALAALPGLVARHFGVLGTPGPVELMSGAVEPFVAGLMGLLIGLDDPGLDRESLVSRIFSRGMGIARRRRAEREVGGLRRRIASALHADEASDEVGYRLAMMILGRDALAGTLAGSLARVFVEGAGKRLMDLAIPEMPAETGVTYVERVAREPVALDGLELVPGERVRLRLVAFTRSGDPEDAARIFGAGAHTCLGRAISLEAWRAIRSHLGTLATCVRVVGLAPRADDIFAVPATLHLEVLP